MQALPIRTFFLSMLIQLFLIHVVSAKVFQIDGKITGQEQLKFAYAFNGVDWSLIQKVPIVNNAFTLKGEVPDSNRFGSLPTIKVLLLADSLSVNEIEQRRLLSQRKHYNCNVVAEEHIVLIYHTDKKAFTVKGNEQNRVQNLYLNRLTVYRNTRDSLFQSIRMSNLSPEEKNEKINQVGAELFTAAMRDFIEIVKAYPDEVSLSNFDSIVYDLGIPGKEALAVFNLFPPAIRNAQSGKSIHKDIEDKIRTEALLAKPAYSVGRQFPEFSLPDVSDEKKIGSDLYGKYTLVDFWATWCMPCRKETPNLINAYQNFSKKDFKIITISIDAAADRPKWLKAVMDDKMEKFYNLFNGGDISGLARELKVVAIPMNYLLDEKGKIIATNLRGEQLFKKLTELLGK